MEQIWRKKMSKHSFLSNILSARQQHAWNRFQPTSLCYQQVPNNILDMNFCYLYIYSDQDISDILNSYLELYSNHKKSQFELTNINLMNSTPLQGIIFFLYMPSWWRDIPFAVRVNICNMPTTLILYKEIFHCSPMKIVSMGKIIKYNIFCIFKVEYFTPFWDIHDKNI